MSLTTPATPAPAATPENAPTGNPTSSIPESYDNSGKQVVSDDVFGFDESVVETPDKPLITNLDAEEDEVVTPPVDPATPADPRAAEPKPADPAKPADPVTPATPDSGLKMYADKFKTVQDLKNSFIELGGDPARYGDNTQLLEEAYAVRQREFSTSRAQIAHINQQPTAPQKTFQEILGEEFAKYDPTKFESPQQMWEAQTKATAEAAKRFEEQQVRTPQITPQEMDRQIKIVNNINALETKVPRLRTDSSFRNAFATHIRVMRDEGRMPMNPDGTQNLVGAMKDFIGGQRAVVEEASKAFEAQNDAKTLSTAANADNPPANPAGAPRRSSGDSLADELLQAHDEYVRKYN